MFLWTILWPNSQQPKYVSMAVVDYFKSLGCFFGSVAEVQKRLILKHDNAEQENSGAFLT